MVLSRIDWALYFIQNSLRSWMSLFIGITYLYIIFDTLSEEMTFVSILHIHLGVSILVSDRTSYSVLSYQGLAFSTLVRWDWVFSIQNVRFNTSALPGITDVGEHYNWLLLISISVPKIVSV